MDVLPLFGINVAIFSIFPFYFTTYKNPLRSVSLYIYLSIILTVGGFLGAVYSFPITDSITVSGGNLAYGAFMMSTILLVIVERNLGAVRNVIRLVITVNVVKVLLFSVVSWALDHNDVLNPFSTSSAVFDASLWVVFLGGALIISELLLLLLIFERLKTHLTNVFWLSILYIIFFIVALCLDGVLFPTIFFGFTPELTEIVVGNVKGKFVMALAFSLPMLIFLFTFRKKLTQFVEAPLVLRDLLSMPKEKLVEEIERQRKFLEMNQDQLRRVAQRLSLSTEAAGIGIWDWDLITNMLIWDERMYELYGVRPGMFDDTYQAWEQRLHPADSSDVLIAIQDTIKDNKPFHTQFRVVWPDKQIRFVEAHAMVQHSPDGTPQHMLGVNWDITEQKELETENAMLQEQFYQAQKMDALGRLAGGIAHDFNNLLVPIMGYVELSQTNLAPESKLYANLMQVMRAAERAADLTQQILAFSRQQVLELSPLDLNIVVDEFKKMFQRLIGENIELRTQLTPSLDPIKADKGQIEQVLMNLVINSRDAMPQGGKLTLETANVFLNETNVEKHRRDLAPGHYVMLAVSDTGHGMDAETQERIFDPFFTTKESGKGTGLGLAIVFGIIKQHQGHIWVYSEPGRGTTFKIYLPQAKDISQTISPTAVGFTSLYGTETVLVVEDEEMVRTLVGETLAAYGYDVIEAKSPAAGLELASHKDRIHLLLTDVIMPEMNGKELYQKLLATHPNCRVLYISGYTNNVIIHHGILDEGINFLQKPFTIYNLTRKVRAILN